MTSYFPYPDTRPARWVQVLTSLAALAVLGSLAAGCVASRHATEPAPLGKPATSEQMMSNIQEPGAVRLTTVPVADWAVPLSGLLNLEHPEAKAAGLEDREEKIQIYMHVLEHPDFGTYLVDSGVAQAFRNPETNPHLSFLVTKAMNTDALTVLKSTAEWMQETGTKPAGVFLTHIHLDHIMGLPDLPAETPIYTGPAETGAEKLINLFSVGSTDSLLARQGPLKEWQFQADPDGAFAGVMDVFQDGSVWALHVPGHSPGSTAFLVRSTDGPVLLVGDASHTNWGWNHGVEPGTFSHDNAPSVASLAALRELAARFPEIDVRLGHQPYVPLAP